MKALALIPDSSAQVISGGFLNTTFNSYTTGNGTAKQNAYIGSTGVALLAFGNLKFKF
jgi:hypothetical protein